MELPPFLSQTSSSSCSSSATINNCSLSTALISCHSSSYSAALTSSGVLKDTQEPIFYRQQILTQPLIFTHSNANHRNSKSILQVVATGEANSEQNSCKEQQYILLNEIPSSSFSVVTEAMTIANCFLPSASSPLLGQILLSESDDLQMQQQQLTCSQIPTQPEVKNLQNI